MPNLGKLVARESELEGFYRTAHNRLITNSEEIAFYDGQPPLHLRRARTIDRSTHVTTHRHALVAVRLSCVFRLEERESDHQQW
jgi:ABC-type uncharacterized transport system fused permease/ATPase subunit